MEDLEQAIQNDGFEDKPTSTDEFGFDDFEAEQDTTDYTNDVETEAEAEESVQETPQSLRVKYNHEERDISLDEARELAQKGLNYEKAVERAKQEARDAYIAEQGYEWNGKPITSEAEYRQALQEKELIDKYSGQNVPDEVIQELVENRKFREQFQAQQKEAEKKAQEQQQFAEFVSEYPEVDPKTIPSEVWEQVAQGTPLKFAYMQHEIKQLRTVAKVQTQNATNKQKPIPSVTAFGQNEPEKSIDWFDKILSE